MKQKIPMIILDEHPNWLMPLYAALSEREVLYEKLDISSASFNPVEKLPETLYVNRFSPSAAKRGHEKSAGFTLAYLLHLESQGKQVINGFHTLPLETSKAYQLSLLEKLAIPHPKSIVGNNLHKILSQLDNFSFPIVLKPNCGGSGMGVQKFETKKILEEKIAAGLLPSSRDGLSILQEFITPKDGYIVRVETINKKVVYAMKVFTKDSFNLCPSESCDVQRVTLQQNTDMGYCVATPSTDVRFELYNNIPKDVAFAVETLVAKAGLDTAGIEYVVDKKGDWYVYDINALSILRSTFKEVYGIDGWGILADYLVGEYRKVVRL